MQQVKHEIAFHGIAHYTCCILSPIPHRNIFVLRGWFFLSRIYSMVYSMIYSIIHRVTYSVINPTGAERPGGARPKAAPLFSLLFLAFLQFWAVILSWMMMMAGD